MKANIVQTGQHTQGIEITEEMMELMIDSVLSELVDHFYGSQTARNLEISGRRLISSGLSRVLCGEYSQPGGNKVTTVS